MIVLEGHEGLVTALAYSPDGRTLATGGSDGSFKLWDALAGRELHTCSTSNVFGPAASLSFSSDGRLLAVGESNEVAVWSVASGQLLRLHRMTALDTWNRSPTRVAFHPTEERLAVAYPGEAVVELDPLSDRRLRRVTAQQQGYPFGWREPLAWSSLCYLPSGWLAAGTQDFTILWPPDVDGEKGVKSLHWPNGSIVSLSGDDAGHWLAAARGRGVALYDVRRVTADLRRSRTLTVGEQVNAVALTPDGRTLLAGGEDWTVHVWEAPSGQKRCEYNWRVGPVLALAVSPDGMTVAVSGRKGPQVLIWDLE